VNIEEALSLCEVVLQNAHLRHLDLSDCGLRDDHVEKVCNALIFRRNIDRLSFADNPRIGIDGVRFLAVVLQRCMLLTYVNVSGIRFSQKMAAHFGFAVSKSKLRTLIIHRAGLKSGPSLSSIVLG
jgi:Ran GTPase-activating protein (RanGAP) involved in mRNA processing and transport